MRLQAATMEAPGRRRTDAAAAAAAAEQLLQDDRFAAFFDDTDFAVDERSRTYKELNPNAGAPRICMRVTARAEFCLFYCVFACGNRQPHVAVVVVRNGPFLCMS